LDKGVFIELQVFEITLTLDVRSLPQKELWKEI
jgi:hypothetical protein